MRACHVPHWKCINVGRRTKVPVVTRGSPVAKFSNIERRTTRPGRCSQISSEVISHRTPPIAIHGNDPKVSEYVAESNNGVTTQSELLAVANSPSAEHKLGLPHSDAFCNRPQMSCADPPAKSINVGFSIARALHSFGDMTIVWLLDSTSGRHP